MYNAFNPDNPFYTWKQIKDDVGPYGWFVLPTGAVVGIVLIPVMVVTALPIIRRNIYNAFYYIHITFALLVLVLSSLHSSTNFYFILPGLLLWVYDWSRRVQHGLYYKQTIEVESAGNDWYTASPHKQHLQIVWSIRHAKTADIAEIHTLQKRLQRSVKQPSANLEIHESSVSHRLQPNLILGNFMNAQDDPNGGGTFVYISGPAGLAADAEAACIEQKRQLRAKHRQGANGEISWHNATFTL